MGIPVEYYWGIVFAVLSTLLTNFGILIQKASADIEKDKPLRKRWRFWVGFSLNLGSEAGLTTLALALAPLSLVAPIGGLAVVFNALIARSGLVCGIKEAMTWVDWLCTATVVAGVTCAAVFGPGGVENKERGSITVKTIPDAASQPGFVAYTAFAFSTMALWLFFWKQRCFKKLWRPHPETLAASIGSGFTAALGSGFSTIFLKVLTLQVTEWGKNGMAVPDPLVWVSLFALMIVAPLQLYLLNMTLASGGATFTIPLYLSLCMLLVSVSGAILFKEFDPVLTREPAPLYMFLYAGSICLTMVGLMVLSYRQQKKVAEAEDPAAPHGDAGPAALVATVPSPGEIARRISERRSSRESNNSSRCSSPTPDIEAPAVVDPTSPAVVGGRAILGKEGLKRSKVKGEGKGGKGAGPKGGGEGKGGGKGKGGGGKDIAVDLEVVAPNGPTSLSGVALEDLGAGVPDAPSLTPVAETSSTICGSMSNDSTPSSEVVVEV